MDNLTQTEIARILRKRYAQVKVTASQKMFDWKTGIRSFLLLKIFGRQSHMSVTIMVSKLVRLQLPPLPAAATVLQRRLFK
jgi:uncharacterized membrane protein